MTAYSDDKKLEYTKKTKVYGSIIKRITGRKNIKNIKTVNIKNINRRRKFKHNLEYNQSKYIKNISK